MVDENYREPEPTTNLILGCYINSTKENLKLPENVKVIAYQLEPLIDFHWHPKEKIIANLKTYDEIWEYDYDNYLLLKEQGFTNVLYRPIKYTPSLKRIDSESVTQDIDILFYGTLNSDRANFITRYLSHYTPKSDFHHDILLKTNLVFINGIDDKRLDEYIARSKIIINLQTSQQKHLSQQRQNQARIFYPLINNKCVLSQVAHRNYFGNCILQFEDIQDFGDLVIELLISGEWKNYPERQSDYIKFINRENIVGEE
jgi:hypothetical protein